VKLNGLALNISNSLTEFVSPSATIERLFGLPCPERAYPSAPSAAIDNGPIVSPSAQRIKTWNAHVQQQTLLNHDDNGTFRTNHYVVSVQCNSLVSKRHEIQTTASCQRCHRENRSCFNACFHYSCMCVSSGTDDTRTVHDWPNGFNLSERSIWQMFI